MSEVNKSFEIHPGEGNYTYRKRESQECENDASLCGGSEELQGTDYSAIREPVKDTAFCVMNESPDITDEEAFINQDQQEAHTGYEAIIFSYQIFKLSDFA